MSTQPDRYAYEHLLVQFDQIVRSAQATIIAQIEAAIRSGDLRQAARRQLQLAAVDATLEQLTAVTGPLATRMVEQAWHDGANRALQQVHALPIATTDNTAAFSGVSREAVEALQKSLTDRLDSARQTLGRRVEDVYAREGRRAALRAILGAEGSPSEASRHLQRRLIEKGVVEGRTGFVDKAGKRWALDTYANMATRTITREAVVQGAVARMASHGIQIARVSEHAGSCKICLPFEGTLVALGPGAPASFEGEAVFDTGQIPPYHGNCAHSLEPVAATIESLRAELAGEGVHA